MTNRDAAATETAVHQVRSAWLEPFWFGLSIGALLGGLTGLVEAALVGSQMRRLQSFLELYGYAALIDAGAFATLGGLASLTAIGLAGLIHRRLETGWHVLGLIVAGLFSSGVVISVRWQQAFNPTHALPGSHVLWAQALIFGGISVLAIAAVRLLWPPDRSTARARMFGRWLASGAAGVILLASTVGVARDLTARSLGAELFPDGHLGAAVSPDSDANAAAQVGPTTPTRSNQRPNVVLITVDTFRADHIGPSGYPLARTPTLDRLAAGGVYFARHYTTRNGTTPAHASIFTGTYPSTNGVWTHMFDLLAPDVPTLAELFSARGYATAGFFSWLSFEPAYSGLQRGFQVYEDLTINLPDYLANPRSATLAATYKRLKSMLALPGMLDRQLAFSADIEEVMDGKADVTTDAVMLWLQEHAGGASTASQPFFLWVHYWDPHYPFTPPPPFDQIAEDGCNGCPDGSIPTIRQIQSGAQLAPAQTRHLLQYYDGEIAFTDQELGRLLDTLEGLGLAENTLVAVTGDHGESFGELGRWLHGFDLYVPEIHVPLIMRFPGRLPPGRVVQDVSSAVDIMPTVLDLLAMPIPAIVEGHSLLPLVRGEGSDGGRFAISELNDRGIVSFVTRDWQLLKNYYTGELRLFRPTPMPLDQIDRAAEEPHVAAELEERLDRWEAAHP